MWVQGEVDVLVELISKENGLADNFLEDMEGVLSQGLFLHLPSGLLLLTECIALFGCVRSEPHFLSLCVYVCVQRHFLYMHQSLSICTLNLSVCAQQRTKKRPLSCRL